MEIRAYQEREPDDAQICTFAFGVPTLGEYSVVLSIDEGVEIGGIKEQGLLVASKLLLPLWRQKIARPCAFGHDRDDND
jgi:hypothetical protein